MPLPSFSRPTLASFSPSRRTSALRLFLGDVVRASASAGPRPAIDRMQAIAYVRTGQISFCSTVDRFSLVAARGQPAFLDHLTIARGRAERALFASLHADAAEEQQGDQQTSAPC